MPCTYKPVDQVRRAVARLEEALAAGTVTIKIGSQGSITFAGWTTSEGVADLCAYRRLYVEQSPALRRAVLRAEALAGRKIDPRAIQEGVHSHDGGQTWSKHT